MIWKGHWSVQNFWKFPIPDKITEESKKGEAVLIMNIKRCVHYLNRCTTSPTYILHQLNKKMSLQSLIISSLTLNIVIFQKSTCEQPHPFQKPRCIYEIYNKKIETNQLSYYVTYWNAQTNPASKINKIIWVK